MDDPMEYAVEQFTCLSKSYIYIYIYTFILYLFCTSPRHATPGAFLRIAVLVQSDISNLVLPRSSLTHLPHTSIQSAKGAIIIFTEEVPALRSCGREEGDLLPLSWWCTFPMLQRMKSSIGGRHWREWKIVADFDVTRAWNSTLVIQSVVGLSMEVRIIAFYNRNLYGLAQLSSCVCLVYCLPTVNIQLCTQISINTDWIIHKIKHDPFDWSVCSQRARNSY